MRRLSQSDRVALRRYPPALRHAAAALFTWPADVERQQAAGQHQPRSREVDEERC